MNIVVAVRCLNEIDNIPRFMKGYDFADEIVVSDGGSTDGSIELLRTYPKVRLIHFTDGETVNGVFWNTDAPHMNFVLDAAKELEPDWLIFDDMDCNPNSWLRDGARLIFTVIDERHVQINAFRLYLWGGEGKYFPKMSGHFDLSYTSLWAWKPREVDIRADPDIKHGTMIGLHPNPYQLETPCCLLHHSWHPNTIQQKIDRYNAIGLPFNHPFEHAGELATLPKWARE